VTTPSRELAAAQRRLADQTSARLAEAAKSGPILGTVATVTAGAASDGNALVTVTWRGATFTVAGLRSRRTRLPSGIGWRATSWTTS
jgi:hypothetical protein